MDAASAAGSRRDLGFAARGFEIADPREVSLAGALPEASPNMGTDGRHTSEAIVAGWPGRQRRKADAVDLRHS